jgi:UDP-glucose 4-epimerase
MNEDILNEGVWKKDQYDVVYHLSAQTGAIPSMENPVEDALDNIIGTLEVIKNNPNARIIFATSGASLEPESPYGLSKKTAEEYIKMLHKDYVICRLSSVFGEKDRGVVDNFLRDEKPKVYGDGSAVRDFVFVYDIIEALYLALEWEVGEYSLGSGKGTSVNELVKAVGKMTEYVNAREGEKKRVILENTTPNWKPSKTAIQYIKEEIEGG